MACLSDMSLGSMHEGLQMPPGMPLHSFAAFDQERLSRIARWRSTPGSSKEVIRCYVKVILALAELHGAAAPLQLSPCIAINSAKKTKLTGPPPSTATLALPAKSRTQSTKPTERVPKFVGPSMPKSFGPLPAQIWNVLGSWTAAMHLITQLMLVLATWIPIGLIVVGVVILICDPGLLLKLVWNSLQALPQFIRSNLADAAVRPPAIVHPQFEPSVPRLSAVPSMSFEPPSQPVPHFPTPATLNPPLQIHGGFWQ